MDDSTIPRPDSGSDLGSVSGPELEEGLSERTGLLGREGGDAVAFAHLASRHPGAPTVMFLPGFRSSMDGLKAMALRTQAAARGWGCVRFDYFGHGRSSGSPDAGTIGRWRDDVVAIIDEIAPTAGPLLLVGSSMGGWLGLLAAAARPDRIAGLITVAVAADFTTDLLPGRLSAAERAEIEREGVIRLPTPYGSDPYPISRALLTEGEAHRVLTDDNGVLAGIRCPVRLVHGMRDPDIPWQRSVAVTERLTGTSAHLTLVNDGDHRLSRPRDLALIGAMVDGLAIPGAGAGSSGHSAEFGLSTAPEDEQENDAKTHEDRGGRP